MASRRCLTIYGLTTEAGSFSISIQRSWTRFAPISLSRRRSRKARPEPDLLERHGGPVTVAGFGLAGMGVSLWVGAQRAAAGDHLGAATQIVMDTVAGTLA